MRREAPPFRNRAGPTVRPAKRTRGCRLIRGIQVPSSTADAGGMDLTPLMAARRTESIQPRGSPGSRATGTAAEWNRSAVDHRHDQRCRPAANRQRMIEEGNPHAGSLSVSATARDRHNGCRLMTWGTRGHQGWDEGRLARPASRDRSKDRDTIEDPPDGRTGFYASGTRSTPAQRGSSCRRRSMMPASPWSSIREPIVGLRRRLRLEASWRPTQTISTRRSPARSFQSPTQPSLETSMRSRFGC